MDDDVVITRADQIRLYLDTLRARMEPAQFRALGELLKSSLPLLTSTHDSITIDIPDEDERHVTPEVKDEFLAVLGILSTGSMDHHIVDLGNGASAMVHAEAAADPGRLQELRTWADERRRQLTRSEASQS
ncbi:hypothetical protein [Kitasatospora azatica]|uniref:hypothetical protein n=1 Tax=Kitasatospora azatica TaxID=58347 RepID=UPI00055B4183|nr:hypothetical protein [Kitasatospora azatica]